VVPRARVNIIVHLVVARSTGVTGRGMHDRVALAENCAGSLIPLARRIATAPNFPMHSCWFLHFQACAV